MNLAFNMSDSHSTYHSCAESTTHPPHVPPLVLPEGSFTSEPTPMTEGDTRRFSEVTENGRVYRPGSVGSPRPSILRTSRANTGYFTSRDDVMQHARAPATPVSSPDIHDSITRRLATVSPTSQNPPTHPRNLVVCIDGTSNQFGMMNTNVIELYSHILKGEDNNQLTYYDSGIGTFARPSWRSLSYLKQVISNKIDLAIAWNLETIIIGAYRWLSNHYRPKDKIFLFGFSRGALQVRALAGMIELVGLILPGNESQIPFAYELYADYDSKKDKDLAAPTFKNTFSRIDVRVHFVGVWDTVSSVGFLRSKRLLPRIADCYDHIDYFRHALALDERRVKFLPEYAHEGASHTLHELKFAGQRECTANIKEVWFAGTHSDVGGGSRLNKDLQSGDMPLLWMRNEAMAAGLRLKAVDRNWTAVNLGHPLTNSLGPLWKIVEQFPLRRLSYKGHISVISRLPGSQWT
ncbi:hypothetical protein FIBSPDRAFT_490488 [Athelia psychrophila]|uniref:T6SS Phospholipase effector Tle1-like catalytic domain-containing protein n=1 Tax=Athelia psychrophila TaxID=1759441 RepID=A0A166KLV7_9AGAM|nr:hypothetical protein FIBSPDRAFT_490488 [Fibularhizoctonia sp. CBS 109695]